MSLGGTTSSGSRPLPSQMDDTEPEVGVDPECGTCGAQNGCNDDDDDEQSKESATLSDRLLSTVKVIREMSLAALPTRRAVEAVPKSLGPSTTRFQRKREAMYDVRNLKSRIFSEYMIYCVVNHSLW